MLYERIDDLPAEVQALSPVMALLWLNTYNRVFKQTEDVLASTLAAWGAIDKTKFQAVKSVNGGKMVLGWALLFTDEDHPDLHDTHFSHLTSLLLDYYGTAPLWYEHGYDPDYGYWPIGRREPASVRVFAHGVLMGHNLHQDHAQYARTVAEVERGELAYSSDSIGHYVEQGYNFLRGELRAWPFAGCSLTSQPAEPALGRVSLKSMSDHLQHTFDHRPVKVFSVLKLLGRQDAGGVKGSSGGGADTPDTANPHFRKSKFTTEDKKMDPEMLAQLAAFFGVDNTVEAVSAALNQAIAMLEDADTTEEQMGAMLRMSPAALRTALELKADAPNSDVADVLRDIAQALAGGSEDEDDSAEVLAGAARFAREQREARNQLPVMTGGRWSQGSAKRRGSSKATTTPLIDFINRHNPAHPASRAAKAQLSGLGPTGGYVLDHEISNEYIPALRDALPLLEMGVQEFSMEGVESLTIPRDKDEGEAYWVDEGVEIPDSELTSGGIILRPKPVAARIIVPNKMLTNATVNYESWVREKFTYKINRAIMYAALYGTGGVSGSNVGASPVGLKVMGANPSVTNVTLTELGSGNGATPDFNDLDDARGRIEDANVDIDDSMQWLMSPRTKRTFTRITDTDGHPLLRQDWSEGEEPTLLGYRWVTSNIVPNNLSVGTNSDCTDLFLGVWRHMLLGLSNMIEFFVDPYSRAKYLQTEIIAWTYVDVAVEHGQAFEVLSGVRP